MFTVVAPIFHEEFIGHSYDAYVSSKSDVDLLDKIWSFIGNTKMLEHLTRLGNYYGQATVNAMMPCASAIMQIRWLIEHNIPFTLTIEPTKSIVERDTSGIYHAIYDLHINIPNNNDALLFKLSCM